MSKIITFGKECVVELRKVVWPTRDDVVSAVKVVIVSTILVAFFLGVVGRWHGKRVVHPSYLFRI